MKYKKTIGSIMIVLGSALIYLGIVQPALSGYTLLNLADERQVTPYATSTPTAGQIPMADGSNKLDDWVTDYFYGDSSDGDVIISTNTTLTEDMYYLNLTINAGVTVDPGGYIIYVSGTLTNNGTIARDGNDATDAVEDVAGVGGAALASGSIAGGLAGADGAGGKYNNGSSSSSGNAGGAGTSLNPSITNVNGSAGGAGKMSEGGGAGGAGGAAGTTTLETTILEYNRTASGNLTLNDTTDYNIIESPIKGSSSSATLSASAGSGGGGSGGTDNQGGTAWVLTGGGGGAGGNGGIVLIVAKEIINNGTISVDGGAGSDAGATTGYYDPTNYSAWGGGSGGGAGGNGGLIILVSETYSVAGTLSYAAGAFGEGQAGYSYTSTPGAYSLGDNGVVGNAGKYILVNISDK